jgi:integrative and conjugative element protein (TIGR02256 family)
MNILSRCLMALSSGQRMSIKDVTFSSAGAPYTVTLSAPSIQQIVAECSKAGANETGGILIGHYSEDGKTAFVFEATARPDDSVAGRTTFQRGTKGLRTILHSRWKTGQYYVGEWHFHPGGAPEPSSDDFESMKSIAANPNYQCPEPVMIILGGDPSGSYSLSASVFPIGDSPVRLREVNA